MLNWIAVEYSAPERALFDDSRLIWGEDYRRYTEKNGEGFNICCMCGRPTSPKGISLGVWISEGGAAIVHPEDYATYPHNGGDMGWFPVGASCIKRIPTEYRVTNPYDDKARGV